MLQRLKTRPKQLDFMFKLRGRWFTTESFPLLVNSLDKQDTEKKGWADVVPQNSRKTRRLFWIGDATVSNGKHGLSLGQARRVKDFADTVVVTTLAQGQASGAGVGHDVSTNGLLGVFDEHGRAIY